MDENDEQCHISNKCSRKAKHPGLCKKNKVICKLSETCSKVNSHEGSCSGLRSFMGIFQANTIKLRMV